MNCPNCQSQLSCGCQQRKASDGTTVCSNCLMFYEAKLANDQSNNANVTHVDTTVAKSTESAPKDVRITYIPPKT